MAGGNGAGGGSRLEAVFGEMDRNGWREAWITSTANLYYVTGFLCHPHERFLGLYLDAGRGRATLFLPELDSDAALAQLDSPCIRIVPISDQDKPFEVISFALGSRERESPGGIVGLEKNHVNVSRYEGFGALYPGAEFRDIGETLMALRMVKFPQEIEFLRQAAGIAEKALEAALPSFRTGMTELELQAELGLRLREAGSERVSLPMVLAGANSALPHGHTGNYRFRENDFVMIDFGAYVQGYGSDLTRTFLLGEGTEEQAWIYEMVLEANVRAIRSIRVGQPYAVVDRAARELIDGHGYGGYFNHRTGHGLGLEMHEEPSIHGECGTLIAPGHVFTVEPGIYVPGLGGVRIEDDVYVDPEGRAQTLSRFPKALRRL